MTPEQLISKIEAVGKCNPANLMARHFDAQFYRNLGAPLRRRLTAVIGTGIANPDSRMGAYAMHPQDYDLFAPILDPMIRDYHDLPKTGEITHRQDWDTQAMPWDLAALGSDLEKASIRVRVARNLNAFPLTGAMNKQQRQALEDLVVQAVTKLQGDPAFGGQYLSLTPGSANEISPADYDRRINTHQMFKAIGRDRFLAAAGIGADWPHGRGMYISRSEDFLIWVGEEDHLRIIAVKFGGTLNALLERLRAGLEILQTMLPAFATSPRYGHLTSCPTNLGSGLRASLHVPLPRLTDNGKDLTRLASAAATFGLAVRGVHGEHSGADIRGLVDISPRARLGVTECQTMGRLYDGVAALRAMEAA